MVSVPHQVICSTLMTDSHVTPICLRPWFARRKGLSRTMFLQQIYWSLSWWTILIFYLQT